MQVEMRLCFNKRFLGFTLAEVLIVVGIIGIVAALTIPTLIHNQKKAALKAGFLKANALVMTVIYQLVSEKNVTEFKDEYCYYNNPACKTGEYTGMNSGQKLMTDLLPYLQCVESKMGVERLPDDKRTTFYTITGGSTGGQDGMILTNPEAILKDGMILTIGAPSAAYPQIVIDTNGNKGPNRYGYDIFWWRLEGMKAIPASFYYADGEDCALDSGYFAGTTCGQYAIQDKCPWDGTKGYWECLP